MIKGWAVTLVAALFTLSAKDANGQYILITYLSTIVFWLLDAYYLSMERQYRCLYEQVTQKAEMNIDFSMNARSFGVGRCRWLNCLVTGSLLVFYGSLLSLPVVIIIAIKNFV